MPHPFAETLGFDIAEQRGGYSRLVLTVAERHFNPQNVVHGAVHYALADTGMGAALSPTLAEGELCATIEIKISYFKPVTSGVITCTTAIVHRGKSVAHLESRVFVEDVLVAQANGSYAIFKPGRPTA